MTVRQRWNSGIAYAVMAAVVAGILGWDLSPWQRFAVIVIFGLLSLSAVCFSSALEQQERERHR